MEEQKFVEMVVRFKKIGLKETVARTLAVLVDHQWHSLRDIERGADLRQPEVSLALSRHLKKFIEIKEVDTPCKPDMRKCGRPSKHVQMTANMYQSLLSTLQKAENERHKGVLGAIDSVRVTPKKG